MFELLIQVREGEAWNEQLQPSFIISNAKADFPRQMLNVFYWTLVVDVSHPLEKRYREEGRQGKEKGSNKSFLTEIRLPMSKSSLKSIWWPFKKFLLFKEADATGICFTCRTALFHENDKNCDWFCDSFTLWKE